MTDIRSFLQRFGAAVRSTRQSRGISCEGLAGTLGISPTYLRNVENARRAPSMSLLISLLTTLNISMDGLLAAES